MNRRLFWWSSSTLLRLSRHAFFNADALTWLPSESGAAVLELETPFALQSTSHHRQPRLMGKSSEFESGQGSS